MKIIKVLIPQIHMPLLDYAVKDDMHVSLGQMILVPLKNKEVIGVVAEENTAADIDYLKIKYISSLYEIYIDKRMLTFISKACKYYFVQIGTIAKLMLPTDITERKKSYIATNDGVKKCEANLPELSNSQKAALESINNCKATSVLKGVTGSGKTEIYFYKIAEIMQNGGQALFLLPEIALSSQIIERFKSRFGFYPDIWNSRISQSKKYKLLKRIIDGEPLIVIGTRSALFLPYPNLQIIIVDEEHDSSYKQEEGVMYNARDMAVLRGSMIGHQVILGSATPSIETIYNAYLAKYNLVNIASRFGDATMPDVKIIDMKTQRIPKGTWISNDLTSAISNILQNRSQAMLFLNRRGYAPILLCKECGHRITCPSCSSCLVYHKSKKRLECHHCGYLSSVKSSCPECKMDDSIIHCGPGIERIVEEVAEKFPSSRIQIMTKDELKSDEAINAILKKIDNMEIDILIGTQVITKGYHFPHLKLIGVIDADLSFGGGDLRSAEKTFQLLHQVSGRAGREGGNGVVYMQSYNPNNEILKMLQRNEYDEFINYELNSRKNSNMPPLSRIVAVLISGSKEADVMLESKKFASYAPIHDLVRILGPAPALLSKLKNKFRYRILLIADKKIDIYNYLKQWANSYKFPSRINVKFDIDPYNFN